jgi:hypothetical protein
MEIMETGNDRAAQSGSRGSSVVMAVFGTVWWVSGTAVLNGGVRPPLMAVGVACAVVLFVLAVRRLDATGEMEAYQRAAGRFRVVNIVQGLSIGGIIALGNIFELRTFIPGAVAVVVGLHFLPLTRLFGRPEYHWVGLLMIGVGAAGCVAAFAGGSVTTALSVVGMGCALALWASVVVNLVLAARARPVNAGA